MKLFQLEFLWPPAQQPRVRDSSNDDCNAPAIIYRRNPLARRYRLYVDREGRPRVTIPRRGNRRDAEAFAAKHADWLAKQLQYRATRRASARWWQPGTRILFRGQLTPIEALTAGAFDFLRRGTETIPLPCDTDIGATDLRPIIENHLRRLAALELPKRTLELSAVHRSPVQRITIRNQRSRWGSCSRRGTISLNWRLVQVPFDVRDYIILHELMHLREMNHSRRFWALVARVCPNYKASEARLRANSPALL